MQQRVLQYTITPMKSNNVIQIEKVLYTHSTLLTRLPPFMYLWSKMTFQKALAVKLQSLTNKIYHVL